MLLKLLFAVWPPHSKSINNDRMKRTNYLPICCNANFGGWSFSLASMRPNTVVVAYILRMMMMAANADCVQMMMTFSLF